MKPLSTGTLATRVYQSGRANAKVVAMGGDGIGPDVIGAAVKCLRALQLPLAIAEPLHGEAAVKAGAKVFPSDARAQCLDADAILFGACEQHSTEILRFLRLELDTYANLRPTVTVPGVKLRSGDRGADFSCNLVIVREATEGLYPGREGELKDLNAHWGEFRDRLNRPLPNEGRFAIRVITEAATRRIARYAGRVAQQRKERGIGPGLVTIVNKSNVLRHTDGWFLGLCEDELKKLGGLQINSLFVDEAARLLVAHPDRFDVLVTTNMFGDILSDVAAEAMGGLALAPSAGVGEYHAYFEPIHGSAPDIAGKNLANPSAAIFSAAMMLAYLGHDAAAEKLEQSVAATLAAGVRTHDLGGKASTVEFTDAVCQRLM